MNARARQLATRALVAGASLCIVCALIAGYARRSAVDSDQFANRATHALRDESVRSLIAEKITDDVVLANEADLIAARPIIESVASGIVGSRAFTGLFRSAVRDVHSALFQHDTDTVTLTVADVGTVLAAALAKLRPSLAREVESTDRVELIQRDIGSASASLARIADDIRLLSLLLLFLAAIFAGGALALSRDRRRTVVELGIGLAAAGILLVLAYAVLRSLALDHAGRPEGRAAAAAVWDAFLGDLRTAGWILAGSGAVIAAAAASLVRPVPLREPFLRVARWIGTEPSHPALRLVRGIGFIAAGLVVLLEPDAIVTLFLSLLGVFLIYEGTTALLRLIYRPPAPGEERVPPPRVVPRARRRSVVTGLLAGGLITIAIASFVGTGGVTTAAPREGACNGHTELCERTLPEVVLPATHNSMSVPLRGWYSAVQERPIAEQLTAGVRALLIDTHYADRLPNGRLRTYFGNREQLRRQVSEDGVNPDAVDAAERIRGRLGFAGEGERGMYLCHTFCELGATPLESELDDIRDFLVANPEAVLVVINQDYVTPKDFVGAVRETGLERFVYRGPTDRWLTMREMIDRDQRVVLLAENRAGGAPWYQPVYERITEETPYSFSKVAQLTRESNLRASCMPNRGPENASLFLLNHWITTDPLPLPSHAGKVNAYEPLLARARECRRIRGHLPNLVAVNFYARGDLFRAVDTLNGVR